MGIMSRRPGPVNHDLGRNPGSAPFAILFAPAMVRYNPAFGRFPQRDRRLPVGPSAADLAEVRGPCPADAYSDREWVEEFARRTMTREERRDFLAEIRSAELERIAQCNSAEWDEMGIDPSRMEELAGECAATATMSRGYATL